MMQFKTVEEFLAQTGKDAPTAAEKELIAACRAGELCILSETRPTSGTNANTLRAPLLRLLITGGTANCGLHESGVTVVGAWITGTLDLAHCVARGRTAIDASHFVDVPDLDLAKLNLLSLQRSHVPGLFAQGMAVAGSVFLRNLNATGTVAVNSAKISGQFSCNGATLNDAAGIALNAQGMQCGQDLLLENLTATGTVHLGGAKIGGQLACKGAILNGAGGKALNAQGLYCEQHLLLSNLIATGTIDVNAAKIGMQLDCTGATLDGKGEDSFFAQAVETGDTIFLTNLSAKGTVNLTGAKIGGQLACTGATLNGAGNMALRAQRMVVEAGFIFRDLASVNGRIDLTAAHVGDLVDDMASWPKGADDVILNGFTYDRISGAAPVTLSGRRNWLRIGATFNGDFFPQPYTQFARTLRAMGHAPEAKLVLAEQARLLGVHERRLQRQKPDGTAYLPLENPMLELRLLFLFLADLALRWFAGYGHRPFRRALLHKSREGFIL